MLLEDDFLTHDSNQPHEEDDVTFMLSNVSQHSEHSILGSIYSFLRTETTPRNRATKKHFTAIKQAAGYLPSPGTFFLEKSAKVGEFTKGEVSFFLGRSKLIELLNFRHHITGNQR